MPTVDSERTKRADVLRQLADSRFPYPSPEQPHWETVINVPDLQIGIQTRSDQWIYPDIVVTEEPGHFIQLLAVVALRHEVTELEAITRWLPLSKAGPLFLYVPTGQAGRANQLCQQLGIPLGGLRTWRRSTGFGLDIQNAYAGPDIMRAVASFLPDMLRPRPYRVQRAGIVESYRVPVAAMQGRPALPATTASAAHVAHLGPDHLPPSSPYPFLTGAGAALCGFGVIFPAELLGAGVAMLLLGVLGWLKEDVFYFKHDGPAGAAHASADHECAAHADGPHLPPPSMSPIVIGVGAMLTGFGVVFPAELLGAGITLIVLGTLGWITEDVREFAKSCEASHA